jgi:pre-mRNA-splicing factor CWC22
MNVFFGIIAQNCCLSRRECVESFENLFHNKYEIVHRLESVALRNLAKFFAHLLVTDSISWSVRIHF